MQTAHTITGLGILCPLGASEKSVAAAVALGKSALAPFRVEDCGIETCAGRVSADFAQSPDSSRYEAELDPAFRMLFSAVRSAAARARLMPGQKERPEDLRLGLVTGTPKAGIGTWAKEFRAMKEKGAAAVGADFARNLFASAGTAELADELRACGPVIGTAAACNSGTTAIERAVSMIEEDRADAVIAGCAESSLLPAVIGAYRNLGVLCPGTDARDFRPFDREHKGFFIGEGAAAVVIESAQSAQKRGAQALGFVRAALARSEAFAPVAQDKDAGMVKKTLRDLLSGADVTPGDIDYVNLHGSATESNDRIETDLLQNLFGALGRMPFASSTKPYTGHLLSASGMVEFALSLICARAGVMPGNLNLASPVKGFEPFCRGGREWETGNFLCLNFGFGSSIGALAAQAAR